MSQNGLDPEFFIVDDEQFIVPASIFIPHSASLSADEFPVGYDNAAVELRPKPCFCQAGMLGNMREIFTHAMSLMRMARFKGIIPRYSDVSYAPAAQLRASDLDGRPELREFGCSPALILTDDHTIDINHPNPDGLWRSAGFHVHQDIAKRTANYKDDTERMQRFVTEGIHLSDILLGLVDVMMNEHAGWGELSRTRRMGLGYGRAGEFRYREFDNPAFGGNWGEARDCRVVEYRSLSPWLLSSPMWTWWATTSMRHIFLRSKLLDHGNHRIFDELPSRSEVSRIINEGDAAAAYPMWKEAVGVWLRYAEGISDQPDDEESGYYDENDEWIEDYEGMDAESTSYGRVLMTEPQNIEDGGSENNGLAYRNLCRVLMALDNGGHQFFNQHRNWRRLWASGRPGEKHGELGGRSYGLDAARYHYTTDARQDTSMIGYKYRHYRPLRYYNRRNSTTHDYGLERPFNTGAAVIMALDHKLHPVNDLPRFPGFDHLT